jgi:hypothetical protein
MIEPASQQWMVIMLSRQHIPCISGSQTFLADSALKFCDIIADILYAKMDGSSLKL